MDAGAQKHDYAYWKNNASGITRALLDKSVASADAALARDALKVLEGYDKKAIDPYTEAPISFRKMQTAYAVYSAFAPITAFKYGVLPF